MDVPVMPERYLDIQHTALGEVMDDLLDFLVFDTMV